MQCIYNGWYLRAITKSNYKDGENMFKNKQMKNKTASSKTDVEIPNDGLTKLALKAQKNKDLLTALQNLT